MATEVSVVTEAVTAQPITALYIEDLDVNVTKEELRRLFDQIGDVSSVKICMDQTTQTSLGYGYVNFYNPQHAAKALVDLNSTPLNGKSIRISYSKHISIGIDKFTNVFVKNFSESCDEEDLKTKFGKFGSITSVVVMKDDDGNSKQFGFVNFEKTEDAVKSIEVLNGALIGGKEWYVGRAQKKFERERLLKLQYGQSTNDPVERSLGLNNLYIKNLDDKIDDDELKKLFSSFGTITSCKVMLNARGISKGYGFVAFSTSQEACKAISEMNGKMVRRKPLYVGVAERKEARRTRLQALFTKIRPNSIVPAVNPQNLPRGPALGRQFVQATPSFRPPMVIPNPFFPMVHYRQILPTGNPNRFPHGYGVQRNG